MSIWSFMQKIIDYVAEIFGKIGWVLILYCMFFGVFDVFLRYVLNMPSQWIGASLQAAMVLMACFGGTYALNHNAFVKLDLFYANFSSRKKAICDIITFFYTFLFLSILIWKGIGAAKTSLMLKQVTPTGVPIPIYPIKMAIPAAALFTLLVAIKKFINDIITIIQGDK